MRKCVICGTILENEDQFCHECGTKVEIEETETHEQPQVKTLRQTEKPQVEEDLRTEEPQEQKQVEEPQQDDEPKYEWEEEKKSKTWLWVLLAILAIVGVVSLYFAVNEEPMESLEDDNVENVDSVATKQEVDNNAPKSALAFIEEFYKGDLGDNAYIKSHITANVLTKLKNDYDYDCPSNDCLATWVFTAYPAGADMTLEEGPTITSTDKDGVYKLDFWYSFYNGYNKGFETRSIYLTITNIDGRYLISDYQIKEKETNETEVEEFDEAAMMDNLAKRNLEANGLDKNGE
jgi:predicted nucleic acid-binding Zn ribbon protein